ncbi:MAG: DUF1549 domain-containing protein, partial [Planctomycetaceae bacterium]|nr:DUF1549 domain-containing protein [Planctomycetaceae bacterium]
MRLLRRMRSPAWRMGGNVNARDMPRIRLPRESSQRAVIALIVMLSGCGALSYAGDEPVRAEDIEFFEREIRPLLASRCYECHSGGAKTIHGGLRLDSAAGLQQGGDSGPLLVAGQPEENLLIEVLRYDGDIQMPPEGKLPLAEIELFTEWLRRGAPLPAGDPLADRPSGAIDFDAGREFWSFRPVCRQSRPEVHDPVWPRTRIDWFVIAAMQREQLSPNPAADRATLIRRLYFDVIGLPPTPEDVAAFLQDE